MEPLIEMRQIIARHARVGVTETSLAGINLMASVTPSEPVHNVYEPVFALVVQGGKRTVLGDKVFLYGTGQYLVVSVDLPIVSYVTEASVEEPLLLVGLTLKPASIASLLLEIATPEASSNDTFGMGVSDAGPELLDAVLRMLRLLDHPEDAAVLGPMIEREILWRLLNGKQGAMARQIGLADSRLSRIGQAIRWIRTHHAQTLHIDELAGMATMSESSFHRHFRAVTSMSPLQYQKQIRLQRARTLLLTASEDVAAVGYDVGYDSPSQFSREYSRLFGEPPRRDIERLRKGSTSEAGFA